jgi:hypothetical protein
MASQSNSSIAEQLKKAEIRISNSLSNTDIKTEVAKKGYTEEKLNEGKVLKDAAAMAVNKQVAAGGTAQDATAFENKCRQIAHKAYQDLAQICRAKFKSGSPELAKLGLIGKEPKSAAEFVKAANTLFNNAMTDNAILEKISPNGYTVETLTAERNKIDDYENADKAQVSAVGEAETATAVQTQALKDLQVWISEYTKISRVALSGNVKLLEKIGISTAKRGGRRTKKAADTEKK